MPVWVVDNSQIGVLTFSSFIIVFVLFLVSSMSPVCAPLIWIDAQNPVETCSHLVVVSHMLAFPAVPVADRSANLSGLVFVRSGVFETAVHIQCITNAFIFNNYVNLL